MVIVVKSFQKNISLAPYTTFGIGGLAKYFYKANSKEDLMWAVRQATIDGLPFFILGGGSNLLINDKGFDGLVIKNQARRYSFPKKGFITVESGVGLKNIILKMADVGLSGLEWAMGIPGTLGGAIYGNCGAFGFCISESVMRVSAFNPISLEEKNYLMTDCDFKYRESIFSAKGGSAFGGKKNKDIILEVDLKLIKDEVGNCKSKIKEYLKLRGKVPVCVSAGSVFKNFKINDFDSKIKKIIPLDKIKNKMVPAGYLIDACGLRSKKRGGAKISDEHANFIINVGGAKAKDVIKLINLCKEKVRDKFGVELKEEIQYLGFPHT